MPPHIVQAKDDEAVLKFAMAQLVYPDQFMEKVKYLCDNPALSSIDILEYKDGKIVEWHGYPVIADDGSYYAWSWTFRDITEIKKAELVLRKSEQNFRQLAELMPDKITTANPDGEVTYFSNNWEEYAGISREELYAKGWSILMHPDDIAAIKKRWQYFIETGYNFEMEFRLQNKEGLYKWHLSLASAVKDEQGNVVKWIGSMTEIQKIKEEEQRKTDFIKMISHELKTPVTAIKGYVQLLLSMLQQQNDIPISSMPLLSSLVHIDKQIVRLTRLITEMLDLSRLEESKLQLIIKKFSLNNLITETVEDIEFTNTIHTISVHHNFTAAVYGDRDRIEQVLINFINNGIKYSPDKSSTEITIYAAGSNEVAVSVKDFGIGIASEDQKKIFERFYGVSGKSEDKFSGFGIGLFIASEIIHRHLGRISVVSEPGKGSVFTFFLPLDN